MSNLSSLQEKHQTKAFTKYFAFFAFSTKQFKEAVNINFKYTSCGGGLYAPSIFALKLMDKLESIHKNAVEQHQEDNSKKNIIWDALANYETQITGDLDDAIQSLSDYPSITKQDIINEYNAYYNHCVDNDYF